MKHLQILFCSFFLLLFACSGSDKQRSVDGRPTNLQYTSGGTAKTVNFSYKAGCIYQERNETSVLTFDFENDELVSSFVSPLENQVTDGKVFTSYQKKEKQILVEISAEPSFDILRYYIELNENKLPSNITFDGVYSRDEEGLFLETAGDYYATFEYDDNTQCLLKMIIYRYNTNDILYEYNYEYDNNIGAFSMMELPRWYCVFKICTGVKTSYNTLYLNYSHNIVKQIYKENGIERVSSFLYEYNANKAPISIATEMADLPLIIINY